MNTYLNLQFLKHGVLADHKVWEHLNFLHSMLKQLFLQKCCGILENYLSYHL